MRSAERGARSVENAECGKCGVLKMRSVENAECGKCVNELANLTKVSLLGYNFVYSLIKVFNVV